MRGNLLIPKTDFPKDKSLFVQYIVNRVMRENNNFIGFYVGKTGSSKSYSMLSTSSAIKNEINSQFPTSKITFNAENIAFSNKEFMTIINDLEPKKGNIVCYDEAGIGISAKEYWSTANRMISFLLQTFRHRNIITFFTVPQFGFIEKSSRMLCHCIMETCGIDHKKEISYVKPKMVEVNPLTNKIYTKYPRAIVNGRLTVIKKLAINIPDEKLRQEYEIKKMNFTSQLNKNILQSIGVTDYDSFIHNLTPVQKEVLKLRKFQNLSVSRISEIKGCKEEKIRRLITLIKAKGYDID